MTIASAAMDAMRGGSNLQLTVRHFITDHSDVEGVLWTGDQIARQVTEFRKEAERFLKSCDDSDQDTERKRMNNIINDVSRICRKELGQSIVCTSRKTGTYGARAASPSRSATTSKPVRTLSEEEEVDHRVMVDPEFPQLYRATTSDAELHPAMVVRAALSRNQERLEEVIREIAEEIKTAIDTANGE